jgi:hypothetical protein
MSRMSMPLIVSNLGCEMIYIIHQRLSAQDSDPFRTSMVLNDIAAGLFAEEFTEQLFIPQALGSVNSIFQLFGQLAHSSIMRLSTSR